ncbi:MAG: alpha-L-glutamate ligase-like protein [Spirochaetes bacterium]|nr:alpha-L-glutamate ligase-like protein [Spirochaetota bacterium]
MFRKLSQCGVLGMNARIGLFMLPYNKRSDYPKADDKIITFQHASLYRIPVPENYAIFDSFGSLKQLSKIVSNLKSFVIKPAKGAMGNGIIVIVDRCNGSFIRADGKIEDINSLRYHISHILSGFYSIDGYPDRAIIQYKIQTHNALQHITYRGVPDVRVIVFKGFPTMAMLRLPTKKSGGRANLHQGGIGVGIDINTGKTANGVMGSTLVTIHPDTGRNLAGIAIPFWNKILHLAAVGYEISHLGFFGADIALDNEKGPLLLELNARPGLSIQLANMAGLRKRLKAFECENPNGLLPEERIQKALAILQSLV